METLINTLYDYLTRLERDMGWELYIQDYYGIIKAGMPKRDFGFDKKWHTNPYCMLVKSNPHLWTRCVNLKPRTRQNISNRGVGGFNVCYCGVAEYTVPVFINGIHFATVCATGFYAPIGERMQKNLANATGVSRTKLNELRTQQLNKYDNLTEEGLKIYLNIAASLLQQIGQKSPLAFASNKEADNQRKYVISAIEYIEAGYKEDISPKEVAEKLYISLSHLQHLFVKFTGEGIAAFIRQKRLKSACELLAETNKSVREIALACGFNNTDYFSVMFNREYGITPLKFRAGVRISK